MSDWECEHHTHLAKIGSMLIVCDEMWLTNHTCPYCPANVWIISLRVKSGQDGSFRVWARQCFNDSLTLSLGGCLLGPFGWWLVWSLLFSFLLGESAFTSHSSSLLDGLAFGPPSCWAAASGKRLSSLLVKRPSLHVLCCSSYATHNFIIDCRLVSKNFQNDDEGHIL